VQKRVRTEGPNPKEELISKAELERIRALWRREIQDWEDSVPKIYREVMGEDLDWILDEQPGFSGEDRAILDSICERYNVPAPMVAKLIDIEREFHGMSRRATIYQRIAAVFDEDWRSEAEIVMREKDSTS
jgi:DNA sulfur modification protein DndC